MLQKCKACKNDKVKDLRGSKNLNLLKDERKKLLMRNKFLSNLLQSLGSIHKISESIGYIFRRWTRKWLAWLLFPVEARKGHGARLWNLHWRQQASLVYGPISKLNKGAFTNYVCTFRHLTMYVWTAVLWHENLERYP